MIRQTVATPTGASAGAAARQGYAAELLFARYRDQIYRFCFARLRSREGAEDATQDVFMRVHMALKRGVVPEYEAAWLYKIAHNVCLSKGESTARRARLETPHAFDDEDFPVAAREVSHDELAGLSDALAAMPAKMRKAILLREWQGLSYAEIAEAMGLTVSAVETLLFRARRELAAALEQGPAPKRRLAGLFPLPGLFRRLLGALAPAKLAAGAALVALTGGGVGLGLSIAASPATHVPHGSVPAGAGPVTFLAGVGGLGALHGAPAISVSVPAPLRRPAEVGGGAGAAAASAQQPGIAAVVPSFAPAAQPRQSEPVAPVPTAPVTTVASSLPVSTTSVPAVQAPSLPAVAPPETPSVSVPAVTVPTVDVPTVSDPATSLPVSVPVVTLP